ncbi:MAG: hypothetical protein LBP76_07635 [Treponema sp.]|jgi:hypothetical protein|nr:hypothetical protein [Treponema sp.]
MKKYLLVLLTGVVLFLCFGCVGTMVANSAVKVDDGLIVQPDPKNQFTGTWLSTGASRGSAALHVIQGTEGAWYRYSLGSWKKTTVYTIKQDGQEYITSTQWPISINGNILTVGNMTYERYTK